MNPMTINSAVAAASSKDMVLPKIIIPMEHTNGNDEVYAFEHSQMDWCDIRAIWKENSIAYPLCFAAPENRIEMFFFYACQTYGTPCSLGSVYNPSWTDMFLSKVEHDCLVISAPLVSYIVSNNLFSHHISKLRLLISIGDINRKYIDKLQSRFLNLKYEALPHPITSLIT